METLSALAQGFSIALSPVNLLWALLGCALGTAVGVLPGIGPALAIALLLPITFQVPPEAAFILFAGIYYGAGYGGSTTAILLNVPGESSSIITSLEGHAMALAGRAGPALATAAIGSFVAGTLGTLALTFIGPHVAALALHFGPADYFGLTVFAFMSVSAVLGRSALKGLAALALGVMLGAIGVDGQTGQPRFTFGVPELLDGISVVLVAVALFAVSETLDFALAWHRGESFALVKPQGALSLSRDDWSRSWRAWLRGTGIGFPIGALPAGGGELPTFISYWLEKRLARRPQEFGHGAIEGVAGPEAANNAAGCGVLLPLLTLGLPTSATAALILSAFQSYGIRPGPFLFTEQGALVWTIIASLYIGNVMLLVLNLPLVGVWVRFLRIPPPHLFAGILMFATIGTYGISGSVVDLVLLYTVGAIGLGMRRFGFPAAPVIIGMVLGPIAEQSFRQAMTISQGDPLIFLSRPIAAVLLITAALVPLALLAWRNHCASPQTIAPVEKA